MSSFFLINQHVRKYTGILGFGKHIAIVLQQNGQVLIENLSIHSPGGVHKPVDMLWITFA